MLSNQALSLIVTDWNFLFYYYHSIILCSTSQSNYYNRIGGPGEAEAASVWRSCNICLEEMCDADLICHLYCSAQVLNCPIIRNNLTLLSFSAVSRLSGEEPGGLTRQVSSLFGSVRSREVGSAGRQSRGQTQCCGGGEQSQTGHLNGVWEKWTVLQPQYAQLCQQAFSVKFV